MYSLFCIREAAAGDIVNATNLSSTTGTTSVFAAAAAATTVSDDDVTTAPLRLRITPRPNDNGQLVKAVGSSVVITCQRVGADDDNDDDDDFSVETPTIEWLDKNAIRIPEQTSNRYW